MSLKEKLIQSVIELDENEVYPILKEYMNEVRDASEIINCLREGVEIVGEKFQKKEYFLTELVMAGEIFVQSIKLLEPILRKNSQKEKSKGIVVVGTVKGDVHDIGKNIFITLLQVEGYDVYDLGVDIPPENFMKAIKEFNANIVGYSGLLTIALNSMRETTQLLEDNNLRDKVKIIIGGLPVDEMWMREARADAFTDNAFEGVKIINQWIREENQ
ncbi:MAG: B12-binding domain-containing protein [Candidatus Hermodarchaeota archaeon]